MPSLPERKYGFTKREPFFNNKYSLKVTVIPEESLSRNGFLVNFSYETPFIG